MRIDKTYFKSLIIDHIDWLNRVKKISEVLDSNIYECDWIQYTKDLFLNLISTLFTEKGYNAVEKWMFEESDTIDYESKLDNLWDNIKQYCK